MLKLAATRDLILCKTTLWLPSPLPATHSNTPWGIGQREFSVAFTLVFVPQSQSDGPWRKTAPFSWSFPKSQATNLGDLGRKLIKYTSCVFTATKLETQTSSCKPSVVESAGLQSNQEFYSRLVIVPKIQLSPWASPGKASSSEDTELFGNSFKLTGVGVRVHHDYPPPSSSAEQTSCAPARGLSPLVGTGLVSGMAPRPAQKAGG